MADPPASAVSFSQTLQRLPDLPLPLAYRSSRAQTGHFISSSEMRACLAQHLNSSPSPIFPSHISMQGHPSRRCPSPLSKETAQLSLTPCHSPTSSLEAYFHNRLSLVRHLHHHRRAWVAVHLCPFCPISANSPVLGTSMVNIC